MSRLLVVLATLLLVAVPALADDVIGELTGAARDGRVDEALKSGLEQLAGKPGDLPLARYLQDLFLEDGRAQDAKGVAAKVEAPLRPYLEARLHKEAEALDALHKQAGPEVLRVLPLDLAHAWMAEGKPRKAEKDVRAYLSAVPDDAEGWELLGRAKHALGTTKSATDAFEKALELDPGRPGAAIGLSELLFAENQRDAARRVLEEALARYPRCRALRLGAIDDHLRRGEAATAKDLVAPLVAERPKDLAVLIRHAYALRGVDRYDEAEKVAQSILSMDPEHARALEVLGFVLEKKDKFAEALEKYLAAVKLDPSWADACVSAAFMQLRLGNEAYAERMLERAFDLDKNHAGAHRVQGVLEFLRDKNRDAKKHLKIALKANPDDVSANRTLGYIALAEGKAKDALEFFRKLVELNKRDAASWRMVGRASIELGKLEDAFGALERAKEIDPKDAWIHLDLGKVYEEQGDFDKAKESYEEAIKLDEKLAWPHLYMAEILDHIDGEVEPALDHYERFLELGGADPEEEVARRVRQIRRS